nr:MAG TPA: tail fiber protein [Caudoviricetes sp.]
MIDVVPNAGVIALGKQGENQAVRVTLPNIRAGSGSILLLHQRAADQQPYPVPVVEADGGIIWTVSSTDTAYPGRGQAELQWLGADNAVIKSAAYQTNIIRALTAPGAVPDEPLRPYTQAVAKDAQAAKNAAASAAEAARSAEASAGQAGLSAATASEAAKKVGAIVGQAGQSAQSAQAAALAAAQNAAAAETAEEAAEQAQIGAEAAKTEAQTAKTAAEKAVQEAKTAQTGAVEAKTGAETAQAKAEEAAQGVAADRDQIRANTAGLEAAQQDVTALKAENTALKAETARTARSLDYLWKKSKGIIYDTETVTGAGSSVTVPTGAMEYAALRKLGGMSQRDVESNVLIDAPVDTVRVQGKNLITGANLAHPATVISCTYTYQDEKITLTATKTDGWARTELNAIPVLPNQQYIVSARILEAVGAIAKSTRIFSGKILVNGVIQNISPFWGSDDGRAYMRFTVPAGAETVQIWLYVGAQIKDGTGIGDTITLSDMQMEAATATSPSAYAPYQEPVIYPIPQAIRDLCPDYGQGTAESYNYIDFAAKTYYHVGSMTQDGTWTALATPETIDLSAVWPDDFGVLRVEAGGTINLHYPALDDGYELAVPSETEIMVDVAKVVQTNG